MVRETSSGPGKAGRSPDKLLARVNAEASRLRARIAELEREKRQARNARQVVAAPPAPAPAPFQIPDPRRKPRAAEKVLPPLTAPLRFGRAMGAAVAAELRQLAIETRRLVRGLARQFDAATAPAAMDASPADTQYPGRNTAEDAHRKLDALLERYRQRFAALADEWSRRMVTAVTAQSTAQLTLGLKDVAERMEIHATIAEPRVRAVLEGATQANAALIRRIPEQYLGEVQIQVMTAITTGSGLAELVPYLTKRYEDDARHAHLVALDQIRKASANVNAARLQEIGVEEYVWIHTGGERYPRELHLALSGKTYRYDDPPIIQKAKGKQPEVRGKPGDLPFCRCTARPVLKFTGSGAAAGS